MSKSSLLMIACLAAPFANVEAKEHRDVEVTIHVRRALQQDEDLSNAPISVQVVDGRAILTGKVDRTELSQRADRIIAAVNGVLAIDNKIEVGDVPRVEEWLPFKRLLSEDSPAEPPPRAPEAPGKLASRPAVPNPRENNPLLPRRWSSPARLHPSLTRASAKRPDIVPVKRAVRVEETSLRDRLVQLYRSNPRYATLRLYLRNGTVIVRGRALSDHDLNEMARGIARLDGVRRVSIENVDIGG